MIKILEWRKMLQYHYRKVFSIEEIETEPILQWMLGASLFFFFITFHRWLSASNITIEDAERGDAVCWEYFQQCADFFFLHDIGYGYSLPLFYMGLYSVMLAIVYFMWKKNWVAAHAFMMLLFTWEVLVVLVLSFKDGAPYYYYHIALTAVLLFAAYKEFFLKLTFVFMYFVSVTTKFDATWILGSYFTPLKDGLPLFPDTLTPLFTNLVIFMQTVGSWFLLSKNRVLQRAAFIYSLAFHAYSGIFVLYFYPSVSIPPVLILFGPLYRYTPIPFAWKTWVGWLVIFLLAAFQLLGFAAPGDRRTTLNGNKYGMFMFEANHQCVVTVGTYLHTAEDARDMEVPLGTRCAGMYCLVKTKHSTKSNLILREDRYESGTAWNRCYPYEWWFRYHPVCDKDANVERVSLQIDHSTNGGPFYRTVDVEDVCTTRYQAFGDNSWIQGPPKAPLIGYPVMNTYN